jgi:hypothetical protein
MGLILTSKDEVGDKFTTQPVWITPDSRFLTPDQRNEIRRAEEDRR